MALDDLVGSTAQNGPMGMLQPLPGMGLGSILQPSPPSVFPIGGGGGLATLPEGHLRQLPDLRQLPGPGYGNFIGLPHGGPHLQQPMPQPDYSGQFEDFGEKLGGFGETLGGYSSQFDKFGEQLGGLGEQMGGYQDALGSFNEQMGGMGQQFETVNNKLDSMEKGIAGLDQQLQTQQQPQQVQQPQPRSFNPFGSPFGFGGFGGLGSLFGRRY